MFGAAIIKLRGDPSWRDLTALYYHFETQPIPNPLSRGFHFLPHWMLKAGVLFNFLAELIAPWFAFYPRVCRHIAGGIMVAFQVSLIVCGNLSFLNWLSIVPALACFDDSCVGEAVPSFRGESCQRRRRLRPAKPGDAQCRRVDCGHRRHLEHHAGGQHAVPRGRS